LENGSRERKRKGSSKVARKIGNGAKAREKDMRDFLGIERITVGLHQKPIHWKWVLGNWEVRSSIERNSGESSAGSRGGEAGSVGKTMHHTTHMSAKVGNSKKRTQPWLIK